MAAITILDPSVPVGTYDAIFAGIEEKSFKFGDRWIWGFEVEGGDHDGRIASAFSGTTPTLKSNCGRFLGMLVGTAPEKGRSIDPDDHIGRQYRIKVEESDSGESTRVTVFKPLSDDQAPTEANDLAASPSDADETPF